MLNEEESELEAMSPVPSVVTEEQIIIHNLIERNAWPRNE